MIVLFVSCSSGLIYEDKDIKVDDVRNTRRKIWRYSCRRVTHRWPPLTINEYNVRFYVSVYSKKTISITMIIRHFSFPSMFWTILVTVMSIYSFVNWYIANETITDSWTIKTTRETSKKKNEKIVKWFLKNKNTFFSIWKKLNLFHNNNLFIKVE